MLGGPLTIGGTDTPAVMVTPVQRFIAALALTFLVGASVGYLAGDRSTPDLSATTKPSSEVGARSAARPDSSPVSSAGGRSDAERSGTALSADDDLAGPILAAVRARDYFQRRHDIYEVGQRLDRDSIRAAMQATQEFSNADREAAQYPLLARWLELDAAAAYEWVNAVPVNSRRSDLMREFFHSLGMKDPAAALTFLQQNQANPKSGEDYTYSVFEAWSVTDPVAAVNAAFSLPTKKAQGSALNVALGRWAKLDPEGALARAAQIPDAESRRSNLGNVLHEWAEENAQDAANHALGLPEGKERNDALRSVVSGAASNDPGTALQLLDQIPASMERTSAIRQIVGQIGYSSPEIAAKFVLALPPNEQRNSVFQVSNSFARQDRTAALDWASQLTSAEARNSAFGQIVQQWAADDPKSAAEYCVSNALGTPDTVANAVASWARQDAGAAITWAGALTDPAQRDAALARGLGIMGGSDPQQAATLAMTMLTGAQQVQALGGIAGAWATKDPSAAAAWAEQLTDANARSNAVSRVAGMWAQQDPAAVRGVGRANSRWRIPALDDHQRMGSSGSRGDGEVGGNSCARRPRDRVLATFSQTITDVDPAGAVAWAATIAKPQQRDSAISQVYQQWKRTDPKAADAWLRSTTALSEQAKANLSR